MRTHFASSPRCCLELFPPCGSPSISLIQLRLDLAIDSNILVVEHPSTARDLCAYTDSYFKAKLLCFIKNKVLREFFFIVPHHFDYWKSTRNLFTKESQASLSARNYLQVGLTGFYTSAWRWVEQQAHATSCICEKLISPPIKAASNSNQGLFCSFSSLGFLEYRKNHKKKKGKATAYQGGSEGCVWKWTVGFSTLFGKLPSFFLEVSGPNSLKMTMGCFIYALMQ